MRDRIRSLRATYLQIDPRSLGLFRIGFALLLLFDLAHRFRELDFWYTNSGLLPNHTLLWRPAATHMFSFFFMASSGAEARVGFLVCGAVYVCLLFGYRTRTMQLLAAVCRISLNSRLAMLENGGGKDIAITAANQDTVGGANTFVSVTGKMKLSPNGTLYSRLAGKVRDSP